MARPTKYSEELQQRADGYLDWAREENEIPSAVGLAIYLGISKSTLYEWVKIHKELSDTLRNVDSAQEQLLISKGLTGTFNSTITKLMLSNHGYSDKQDIKAEVSTPTPILGGIDEQTTDNN